MRIKLIYSSKSIPKMQFQPVIRYRDTLAKRGIKILDREESGDFDIAFLSCKLMKKISFDELVKERGLHGKPIVLLDSQDSPNLGHFFLTNKSEVIGYIKKQVFKNREFHWNEYSNLRHHFHLLKKGKIVKKEQNGDMNKLLVGWNLGMSDMFKAFLNNLSSYEKTLDVHSSGTLYCNNNLCYIRHRSECYQRLGEVTKRRGWSFSGKCKGIDYKEKMRHAKIGVSPWGLGEICFRNFEMIRTGTIVIAPETKHLETWPDIFKPGETYIPCAPDFSDLEEKIGMLLSDYDRYKEIANNAYQLMQDCWKADIFADYFINLLNQIEGIQI